MQKALNELFGRAVVDPQVREAYNAGQIEQILQECGFAGDLAGRLSALSANSLEDFLNRVHKQVETWQGSELKVPRRWPSDGLPDSQSPHIQEPG